jgi:uncharacterized protein YbjT (DUF2867 family)
MAKYTFAIVGASGQIGHVLTEELLNKGHKVHAVGRDAHKLQDLKDKGAEILSGDFTDSALLAKAFKGCHAVLSFIPPAYNAYDFEVYRDRAGEAIAQGIAKAKISHVLNLSSVGANLHSGTGPIKELHLQEERLNSLPNLNVLHFRANYFMENLLQFLPNIKGSGMVASCLNADLAIPMVATRDIGLKMAEFLNTLKFTGSSVFDFCGPRAITIAEAINVIGKAIGKPKLKYEQISYEQAEKELIASGMKHQIAKLWVEMIRGFNEGIIVPTQKLTAGHKGKITIEEFAKTFSHMYRSTKKAA